MDFFSDCDFFVLEHNRGGGMSLVCVCMCVNSRVHYIDNAG